jgi:histidinol-phosphate aminotransferase
MGYPTAAIPRRCDRQESPMSLPILRPVSRRNLLRGSPLLLAGTAGLLSTPGLLLAQEPARRGAAGVRLAANENAYGPCEGARRAIAESIDDIWQYAFGQEMRLKQMIAEREGLTPAQVLITAGSAEAIQLAGLVYGLSRGEMITADPTFSLTTDFGKLAGSTVRSVPLDDTLTHDLDAMAAQVTANTSLMYLCNPNNPTGTLVPGDQLRPFVSEMAKNMTVLVDEAYLDLSEEMARHTALPHVVAGENVIVTRTFSKLHGLAGLRIGYALARPEVVEKLEAHRMGVLNLAGLRAAVASLEDEDYQRLSRQRVREALAVTTQWLDDLGFRYADTWGNFVFFDTRAPAGEFSAAMREAGFQLGRPYGPYPDWCRISMGTVEQMQAFAAAARGYFAGRMG